FKVQTTAGTTGWVAADFVALGSSGSAPAPAVAKNVPAAPKQQTAKSATQGAGERLIPGSSRGAIAARVALRYVGARYRWGGASPRGFDCSGLVLYAYRQAGLRLPHKAASQFSTRYGARIRSIGALKTGDIVFFANTAGRGITHVAIYVGNGRMVTANSPRSGVLLQSINTRYWRSHFAGAIRHHG
ncbi:MAG: C40 family peptidase, partial [Chloroflexota bacterium]|nr:C40 family peptidase [Chloroflexota bacterium]